MKRAEVDNARARLVMEPFVDLGFARFDTQRELRQGAPEAVLAEGKTAAEVLAIVVAALHRLIPALPEIVAADCVLVAAGMDGALASVVGGLARVPVIGVPTSVGYGSAEAGRTALNAMLASCASGLAVVGIDDGFGGGTVAALIARASGRPPA